LALALALVELVGWAPRRRTELGTIEKAGVSGERVERAATLDVELLPATLVMGSRPWALGALLGYGSRYQPNATVIDHHS